MNTNYAFCYKKGTSFFHNLASWKKILFIPVFNILIFSFDYKIALFFVVLQGFIFFSLKFTVREQLTDLAPVIWYGIFLYLIDFFTELVLHFRDYSFLYLLSSAFKSSFFKKGTFITVIRFLACNQSAALMFKTSTSLEIREGIEKIETFVRSFFHLKKETVFADTVSLFVNFIPAVFKKWGMLKNAWHARGGKNSFRMYLVLFPVLFSIGLKYTLDTVKAVLIRKI